jgi:hypothetical protein
MKAIKENLINQIYENVVWDPDAKMTKAQRIELAKLIWRKL